MDTRLNAQNAIDSYFVYVLKMEYGWNFWLKVSFGIVINTTKIFFLNPSLRKKGPFCYWIWPKSLFLWSYPMGLKIALRMEEFQKKIFMVFIITYAIWNFMPKIPSIFHFDRVNEVWISGILYVKLHSTCFLVHSISPDPF